MRKAKRALELHACASNIRQRLTDFVLEGFSNKVGVVSIARHQNDMRLEHPMLFKVAVNSPTVEHAAHTLATIVVLMLVAFGMVDGEESIRYPSPSPLSTSNGRGGSGYLYYT